jgi:hypothetical protein
MTPSALRRDRAWPAMTPSQTRNLRNWLMFMTALLLTIYEALVQGGERPFLLTLYASMMGLPLVLGEHGLTGKGGSSKDNDS